ncbi:hypothetical protein NK6_8388 [Bradyrhizobium diazoefficiens]|uniref:Uncharacterized protein n=1 Tax=Bradyrhizobium diazoefficiens TaxID=1355477 RepID=A0A0E4FZD5_9BRAD|nr:hypothetical protein NK6_8388 [Bradyrhizobium diazoefficiens]
MLAQPPGTSLCEPNGMSLLGKLHTNVSITRCPSERCCGCPSRIASSGDRFATGERRRRGGSWLPKAVGPDQNRSVWRRS